MNKIYNKKYNSYGEAIGNVLEEKNLSQKWLVENIIKDDQNFDSLQQQVSRWVRGASISEGYQHRINNALDIIVKRDNEGKWIVYSQKSNIKDDETILFRLIDEDSDTTEEPVLDSLPLLVRLRDRLDAKIQKLVKKKDSDD